MQMQNMVYLMSKVFCSQVLNGKIYTQIPKHWGFVDVHETILKRSMKRFYERLAPYLDSPSVTFRKYLERVKTHIYDLTLFMEQIPNFASVEKGDITYHSLYTENTVLQLYTYCVYSVLHEYVVLSTDAEFKRMRHEEMKVLRKTRDTEEEAKENMDIPDEQVRQIQIMESDNVELRKQVGQFLVAMLQTCFDTKKQVNHSYSEIMDRTMKLKYKDKKKITDYLAGLTRDERKVEQSLRANKLGRWNVGLQKGLFQYDKNTYLRETEEDGVILNMEPGIESGVDVEDLERLQEDDNRVYEDEATDLSPLDEEYENGHFYEEDYAEDRETDF